jgi:hypothetical protein
MIFEKTRGEKERLRTNETRHINNFLLKMRYSINALKKIFLWQMPH